MSETLMFAIDELKSKVNALADEILKDERLGEIKKLLSGLNALEELCGQPKTTLGGLLNFAPQVASDNRNRISVEFDEFVGLDSLAAAKKYLKKPQRAVPFTEIVAAVREGGGDPGNEDRLRTSLARSTWDIVKIGEDNFGLLEFYPQIKRGKKKKKNGSGTSDAESASVSESDDGNSDSSTPETKS